MKKKRIQLNDAKTNQLIHKIGLKYNLRDIIIRNIVESQFKFTYDKIRSFDLEGDLTKQNLNFYYKYIGKLYINKKTK